MDKEATTCGTRLVATTTDADGSLGLGYGSRLLAGRQADRIGIPRRDSAGVGQRDGRAPQDADGSLGLGYGSRLLAGRQADRIGIRRPDSADMGRVKISEKLKAS